MALFRSHGAEWLEDASLPRCGWRLTAQGGGSDPASQGAGV